MSAQFWRFGNSYNDTSAINTLLENGFIERNAPGEQKSDDGLSSSPNIDYDDSQYDDMKDDEIRNYSPNLNILPDLLDEQDILEELASSNIKLIQYLRHRMVLEKLVDYILTAEEFEETEEGEEEDEAEEEKEEEEKSYNKKESSDSDSDSDDVQNSDEKETAEETHTRRAQVAAEILSAEAWSLTDSFMDNSDLLGKLWNILDKSGSLSMTLSTYFMKINEHLLDTKTDDILNFLLHQEDIVDRFLRHIDNPPLMDFLLKVISTDKPDNPSGIIELLKEQNLISKLIAFLEPNVNSSIQSAAGDFIKAFVTISANSNTDNSTVGPNELTRELVSAETMEELSTLMLHGGTSLANGVAIIIEIIRKNNSDYDYVPVIVTTIDSHPPTSRDPIYLGHLIKVFSRKISQFSAILENTKLPKLDTPFGSIEPLGFERFKICELVAELLHCSNMGLLNDESGETIVQERDTERQKVIALEKQEEENREEERRAQSLDEEEEDGEEKFDTDVSRDINRLSISSGSTDDVFQESSEVLPEDIQLPQIEFTPGEENDTDRETLKHREENEVEDRSASLNEEKDEKKDIDEHPSNVLESEPDSEDADGTVEIEFDENEALLRKQFVIGDQLKIALADNKVILKILKMFFRFPWNNFLHNVVFDIVQQILNGSMDIGYNRYLAIDLFGRGAITELIIDGQKKCEEYEIEAGLRLGYMGHLTLIAEEVVKFTALYPPTSIHDIVVNAISTDAWTTYVSETLVETREKYNALLGGSDDPDQTTDALEEDEDNKRGFELDPNVDHDIAGSGFEDAQNRDGNDRFSRYMSQQLTSDFPDKSGSSDEDEDEDELVGWNNQHFGYSGSQEHYNEDDYVDPNDDGQSYTKKNHPLYSNMLSLAHPDSGTSDDDDDEDNGIDSDSLDNNDGAGNEDVKGYTLTRTKSNGEVNWDSEDQDRL
ncbi:hypothetical protein WICMUC_004359 [Wickerhamomyces mucosus]|uniref:Uncharacterized protein n=1 Tax=Wickerhamomyces mucosus TaxID=1378264 RepID=A0A9P8PJ09_9ASCO|nr:hypothetical protein WICMUC_004359 [Wickerhamomyces mucosus]